MVTVDLLGRMLKGMLSLSTGLIGLFMVIVLGINLFVMGSAKSQIYGTDRLGQLPDSYQKENIPVLVLGAGIIDNAHPSKILELRLQACQMLYASYPDKKLIMTGDHRESNYNEVGVMKNYLLGQGVPSEQIYLDHAGYSTYDSLYRLKYVFHQDQAIIVTQKYHLSRALMLARSLGIDAIGVAADENPSTRKEREIREVLARVKDFSVAYLGFQPDRPTNNYDFSLSKNGDLTNNKDSLEKN